MNTINSIRPYVSLKNEPTQTQTQTMPSEQAPVAFRGALGDTLLREATANKSVPTVDTVISKIKSIFGISTDKTKDVLESLLGKIETLTSENAELKNKLTEVTKENEYYTEIHKNFCANLSDLCDQLKCEPPLSGNMDFETIGPYSHFFD